MHLSEVGCNIDWIELGHDSSAARDAQGSEVVAYIKDFPPYSVGQSEENYEKLNQASLSPHGNPEEPIMELEY
jgi:hypothetical protein